MTRIYSILVPGIGAIIGYGIIESLKLSGIKCKIIGTDIYSENYGKYLCDHFVQVPLTESKAYQKAVNNIIKSHEIDLVFPRIEQNVCY